MNSFGLRAACAILASALMATAGPAGAQSQPKSGKKANVMVDVPQLNMRRNLFSGNEARIHAMYYVNADCSSGPLPVVRIVTKPASGELRFDEIKYAVSRKPGTVRFHCNGKIVDAVGVFYKSQGGYVGSDSVVLEVDYKQGTVNRFNFLIQVR